MAIETTPLGFQKPDGNELVRNGDNAISANAQRAQDLFAGLMAGHVEVNFDGGGPSALYTAEQIIDGGTV